MIIDFGKDTDDNSEKNRASNILSFYWIKAGHALGDYTIFERNEKLKKFTIWFEEFAPCKITLSNGDDITRSLITEIEIEEKDYLMLVLKHTNREN